MSDIDHISLNVTDYERSKAFYEATLKPLGIKLLMEGSSGAGFGRSFPHFWIRQGVGTFQKPGDHTRTPGVQSRVAGCG